jgi:hypothetical protein
MQDPNDDDLANARAAQQQYEADEPRREREAREAAIAEHEANEDFKKRRRKFAEIQSTIHRVAAQVQTALGNGIAVEVSDNNLYYGGIGGTGIVIENARHPMKAAIYGLHEGHVYFAKPLQSNTPPSDSYHEYKLEAVGEHEIRSFVVELVNRATGAH